MQRTTKRLWPVIALLIVLTLTLTACGGPSSGGALEGITSRAVGFVARFMPQINLPRITMSYDETGVPEVFGIKTSSLPVNVSFVELPPDTLEGFKAQNIQHAELDVTGDGLFIYVNGEAMPYVAWDRDRLTYIGDLFDGLDMVAYDSTIAKAMPLIGRLGIDVIVKFPTQDGAEAIPVRDRSERVLAEAVAIDEPTATAQAVIQYGEDGVPSIANITTREIGELAQTDLSSVELPPATLERLSAAGVKQAVAVTAGDGLHVLVNEQEVLHLAYNEAHLMNAIELYGQIAEDEKGAMLAELLGNVEPIIYGADIDLVVEFPAGE